MGWLVWSVAAAQEVPEWVGGSGIPHARLGTGVAVGDVDGDGFADVVAAAPQFEDPPLAYDWADRAGAVFVYRGGPAGPLSQPVLALSRSDAVGYGDAVAVGDVNGDGSDDVLVGDTRHISFVDVGPSTVTEVRGRASLFLGGAMPSGQPAWEGFGPAREWGYYGAAAAIGDLDGDGYAEVVVGDWGADVPALDQGAVFVYRGGADAVGAPQRLQGPLDCRAYGSALAVGDVNGDGFGDLVVGSPDWESDLDGNRGCVGVHLGGPAGASPSPDVSLAGEAPWSRMGSSIAVADVNGDPSRA